MLLISKVKILHSYIVLEHFDLTLTPSRVRQLANIIHSLIPFFMAFFPVCNISTSAQIAFKLPGAMRMNGRKSSHSSLTDVSSTESDDVFSRLLRTKRIAVWPFFRPNEQIVVAASLNGGNVIDRFVRMLRVWCRQLGCPAIETTQVGSNFFVLKHSSSNSFVYLALYYSNESVL